MSPTVITDFGHALHQLPPSIPDSMAVTAHPLRRNGKPQSCEPCRKAKAACDHTRPVCNRCIKRGKKGQCTYHPAPMTRRVSDERSSPVLNGRVEKNSTPVGTAKGDKIQERAPLSSHIATSHGYMSSRRKEGFLAPSASTFAQFLGPTSYSAVFRDNQTNLDDAASSADEEPENPILDYQDTHHVVFTNECIGSAMRERFNFGIRILSHFPEKSSSTKLLQKAFNGYGTMSHLPTLQYCHDSLWSTYGDNLPAPGATGLQRFVPFAQDLFSNENKPLPHAKSTLEWWNSWTGKNTRWETLGFLYGLYGLALLDYAEPEEVNFPEASGVITSKRQYASIMAECIEGCVILCEEADVNNEFAVWMRLVCHLLASQYNGDTSK